MIKGGALHVESTTLLISYYLFVQPAISLKCPMLMLFQIRGLEKNTVQFYKSRCDILQKDIPPS